MNSFSNIAENLYYNNISIENIDINLTEKPIKKRNYSIIKDNKDIKNNEIIIEKLKNYKEQDTRDLNTSEDEKDNLNLLKSNLNNFEISQNYDEDIFKESFNFHDSNYLAKNTENFDIEKVSIDKDNRKNSKNKINRKQLHTENNEITSKSDSIKIEKIDFNLINVPLKNKFSLFEEINKNDIKNQLNENIFMTSNEKHHQNVSKNLLLVKKSTKYTENDIYLSFKTFNYSDINIKDFKVTVESFLFPEKFKSSKCSIL